MILNTQIQGTPCHVRLTYYRREDSQLLTDPMSWDDPGLAMEVQFEVLDLQDKRAPQLEREMLSEDRAAIEQEIIAALDAGPVVGPCTRLHG